MQQFYRPRLWAVIALSLIAALASPAVASASGGGGHAERVYLVTIENLTTGQPFTPPVATTHNRRTEVFSVGDAATAGVQGLAENGGVPGLVAELEADSRVGEIVVADAGGPVLPGGSVSFEITSAPGRRKLSIASMLICTNDGFTGIDSLRLPRRSGQQKVYYLDAYDAGTEVNTEDFDDLVPPCGPLTGVDSGGAGTGTTNPALAEGGVIAHHGGTSGGTDLDPAIHDWDDPVAKMTITRIDGAAVYEVKLTNNTDGQPFTPPVVVTHLRFFDVFTVGHAATGGLQGVAENGNVPGLIAAVEGQPGVNGVFAGAGPVLPDSEATLTVYARPGARRVSIASMLICTNDGFTGLDSKRLPRSVGRTKTYHARGYDAGTEINTEDFDDLVPPCGPLTGVDSGGAGTGTTDPALAEGGVIAHHSGISGGTDLDPAIHDWDDPVLTVEITRLG